jgi:hypothetical protein
MGGTMGDSRGEELYGGHLQTVKGLEGRRTAQWEFLYAYRSLFQGRAVLE